MYIYPTGRCCFGRSVNIIDEEKLRNFPLRHDNTIAPSPTHAQSPKITLSRGQTRPRTRWSLLQNRYRLAQTGTDRFKLVSLTPAKVIAHGAGYHLWFCAGPMSHWLPTGSGDWRTPRGMPKQPDMALSLLTFG